MTSRSAALPTGGQSAAARSDVAGGSSWRDAEMLAAGLEAALEMRAPGVYASTPMVRALTVRVCRRLDLDEAQQARAELAARVRDVGMIGLPDVAVLSRDALSPELWRSINRHPTLGAETLARFPVLRGVAEIVRAHHERWDGEGYPDGLAGESIPLLSRVIAAVDAFVAVASDRPYRRAAGPDVALDHIASQSGAQFDPGIVDALDAVIQGRELPTGADPASDEPGAASRRRSRPQLPEATGRSLIRALTALERIPAFSAACDRAADALAAEDGAGLVAAIESDTGLTVAVLRRGQPRADPRAVVNVPDAVAAIDPADLQRLISEIECLPFPPRTVQHAHINRLRVHAQSVARAVDRIAQELARTDRDDLIASALLHDVGKLPLADLPVDDDDHTDTRRHTPEQRVQREQAVFKFDHASLGSVLIERWGLGKELARIASTHHRAQDGSDPATLIRLADMIAHQAHSDAIDHQAMLALAQACGLEAHQLRDVIFELPQSGSQRRRAQPSPLTPRETDALRALATGKVYKHIAADLGVSQSTVRTHLHSSYAKLKVDDRAQAVLRATEMGWI